MTKKGDLSLNTIVVAAIVLIVLVVLIVIFAGRMGIFRVGLNTCDGECKEHASDCKEADNKIPVYTINCVSANQKTSVSGRNYCCVTRSDVP